MEKELKRKLLDYIRENNPDVLFQLEYEDGITLYLSQKLNGLTDLMKQLKDEGQPDYLIEMLCMEQMTADLRPSKYHYICEILAEEFETVYTQLIADGLLRAEIINMINYCLPVFDDLRFSVETEDNRFLHYAITGVVKEYLQSNSENEKVSNGLQQSAKTQGQY